MNSIKSKQRVADDWGGLHAGVDGRGDYRLHDTLVARECARTAYPAKRHILWYNSRDGNPMTHEQDTLKSHYEFDYSKAKPNRFAARLTEDSLIVVLKPAEESFRQGWREALRGETLSISELWTGIEV